MIIKFCSFIFLMNLSFVVVNGSSLVFVIDDTRSMEDDISEVRVGASAIFRTVLEHRNESQIDNFILITFNDPEPHIENRPCYDPGVIVRANTTDRDVFQKAIDGTHAGPGNYGCPECAMAGIIKGLEGSALKSSIYVFTDATAKDYFRFDEMKKIALNKQSQVVFVLTGQCDEPITSPMYKVYQDTATITGGMVMNINKGEINKVLDYVKKTITGNMDTIHDSKLSPGFHNITFYADILMGEVLLSFTSTVPNKPSVNVYGPDGSNVPVTTVFDLEKVAVYAFNATLAGAHSVGVDTPAPTHAVLSAPSGVDFQHGFSTLNFSSIIGTSIRPSPGAESYLSIKLNKGEIEFKQVQIVDLAGNVLQTLPLQLTDNETNLYKTEAFVPPQTTFKIAVIGYHAESDSNVTRSTAPLAAQEPPRPGETKAPKVIKIDSEEKLNINYGAPLNLTCEIEGNPKPDMVWKKKGDGTVLPSKIKDGKVYLQDYYNVLTIEEVTENATYSCEAKYGTQRDSKEILVEVAPRRYLNISDSSKNVTIDYEKDGEIYCIVDAYPPAVISWYKNDTRFVPSGGNIEIKTSDKSTISITKITLADKGKYTCEAINEDTKQRVDMFVTVGDVFPATIETEEKLNVPLIVGEIHRQLKCKASGKPKPEIRWFFQSVDNSSSPKEILDEDGSKNRYLGKNNTLHLKNIVMEDEGNYTCNANNGVGSSNMTYDIHVFEKPVIIEPKEKEIYVKKGSPFNLDCTISKGKPTPTITWRFKLVKGFRDSPETFHEIPEWKNSLIEVKKATINNSGIYQCTAQNKIDGTPYTTYREIKVHVEYQPKILPDEKGEIKKFIKAETGSTLSIPCYVDGNPRPERTWYKDGVQLAIDGKPFKFELEKLKFDADFSHNGNYTCNARNKLGSDSKTVAVYIIESASILSKPENVTAEIGRSFWLPCETKGSPKPKIRWTHQSFDGTTIKGPLKHAPNNSLRIENIKLHEEGNYTCAAVNVGELRRITHSVQVFIPVAIVDTYKEKDFEVVEGDLALQIVCNATGYPIPSVLWTKDESNLPSGSTYSVKDENTLIIANVPASASGDYTCVARNPRATEQRTFRVKVKKSPTKGPVASPPTYIQKEKSVEIQCPLSHNDSDLLRWFKNDVLISIGTLSISSPSVYDSGEYICRVSTPTKSYSKTIEVIVEYAPTFIYDDYEKDVALNDTSPVKLNCETDGKPAGTIEWFYNGKILNLNDPIYDFSTTRGNPGEYRCEVKNKYGNISRTFNTTQEYCVIHKNKLVGMNALAPIILNMNLSWPELDNPDENIVLPKGRLVYWFCPSSFTIIPLQTLLTVCNGGDNFMIYGKPYEYSDIECNEKVEHNTKKIRQECYGPDTKKVKVGYNVTEFVDTVVYEICFDTIANVPIYSRHILLNSFADNDFYVTLSDSEDEDFEQVDFVRAYDCDAQKQTIQEQLGSYFHNEDEYCFKERQLVSPRDVFPGVPQRATYSYYNVLPQWSAFSENWEEIENRVRRLVRDLNRSLLVWTGTAEVLYYDSTRIFLYKNNNIKYQAVPLYWWKVVQDPVKSSSLAIIQVNHPDLVPDRFLCDDVCEKTGWMESVNWFDEEKGLTYCCNITDFEKAFNFEGTFEPGNEQLLVRNYV